MPLTTTQRGEVGGSALAIDFSVTWGSHVSGGVTCRFDRVDVLVK